MTQRLDYSMMHRVLVFVLSLVGLVDALYFTFAYYGRIQKARWVPEILCAREGSNCVTVVQTPYARVFGVPNSLVGILYYATVMLWLSWSSHVHATEEYYYLFLFLTGALLLASWRDGHPGFLLDLCPAPEASCGLSSLLYCPRDQCGTLRAVGYPRFLGPLPKSVPCARDEVREVLMKTRFPFIGSLTSSRPVSLPARLWGRSSSPSFFRPRRPTAASR